MLPAADQTNISESELRVVVDAQIVLAMQPLRRLRRLVSGFGRTSERLKLYFRQAVASNLHFRQIDASNFTVPKVGGINKGRFLQSSRQCFASYRGKLMG